MASSAVARVKKPALNVINAMAAGPWAILPAKLDTLIHVAMRANLTPEAIEEQTGEPLDHTYLATYRDGVCTIPIEGAMFKRADWFSRISGATSYEDIANDYFEALGNPEISAIILKFDSEGGQVAGCSELARMIYQTRGVKPVIAYVEGCCASAAFWLASACDEIVVNDCALVGSLGCVLTIEITKKQDEMLGIEHIEIVSTQTPNKRVDPTTAKGRAQLQLIVDELAQVFLDAASEYMGVDADVVLGFTERTLYVGNSAVDAGLAHRLGSFEELMAELTTSSLAAESGSDVLLFPAAASATAAPGRPNTPVSETAMKPAAKQAGRRGAPAPAATASTPPAPAESGAQADGAETDPPEVDEVEDPPVDPPAAPPAAPAATQASAIAAAVAGERTRVLAIQALGRPGEEAIIAACVADPMCTPEAAAFKLRSAETGAPAAYLAALKVDEERVPAPKAGGASADVSTLDAVENAIVTAGKTPASPSASR
ncbi:MAG: putative phage-related protein [Candidatus Eremiobacteraeota bacterium]|nr:putative phage-related protein [Candidatus Eremiobacteraeota bacterium]